MGYTDHAITMESRELQKVLRAGYILLIVLSAFVVALLFNTLKEYRFIGADIFPQATVSVTGEGEVFGVPDVARVSFTVSELASDVATAQDRAAKITNSILGDLKGFDIDETDIKTTSYNVFPRYEFQRETVVCVTFPCSQPPGKQVLIGHEVSQSIQLTIRDTESAGEILSLLGEHGVDNLSGLSFEVEDSDALIEEARGLAIKDAEAKAKRLADDLDVKLVRIVNFNEFGGFPQARFFAEEVSIGSAFGGEVPQIPAGENEFSVTVNITYEIR